MFINARPLHVYDDRVKAFDVDIIIFNIYIDPYIDVSIKIDEAYKINIKSYSMVQHIAFLHLTPIILLSIYCSICYSDMVS